MTKNLSPRIINEFKNKTILVTGGTGSIGIAIVKELIKCKPRAIRILSNDENSIFEAKRLIGKNPVFTFVIADVKDRERIRLAMRNVDVVFHAAAMKHVDICEENPFDAVKTNVIGTSNVLEIALIENISKFIFISTDKAINPTSTLGASKLLAERLTRNASSYKGRGKTVFSIVRFGNVIGSRGSVFQIFLHQIKHGKPLTITDSRMSRFIMSLSNAADLILKATNIAKDGEIFILKMPSVKITELAKNMIEVYNKRFNQRDKTKMKISKVKYGERLKEFLMAEDEIPYCHDLGDMYKISNELSKKKINRKNLNSENAPRISTKSLQQIILKLYEES